MSSISISKIEFYESVSLIFFWLWSTFNWSKIKSNQRLKTYNFDLIFDSSFIDRKIKVSNVSLTNFIVDRKF